MRKHSVRKWLHALLDLLPLVVIPVFMVYSHRHQIDSYSVQRTEYNTIHMQQNVVNGLPTSTNGFLFDNFDETFVDEEGLYLTTLEEDGSSELFVDTNSNEYLTNDKVLVSFDFLYNDGAELSFELNLSGDFGDMIFYSFVELNDGKYQKILPYEFDDTNVRVDYVFTSGNGYISYYLKNIQVFNLTQMFGSGNEPTIDEFNTLFPNDYYAVDSNAVAYVPYTRTYNDTDIGSQIFYSLYNSVDKYFNCNKLFSFNGVYNWINFNLFGGNAPLMVDVVYQIIVYEFFMDLIFLIYSVFMFIIDFASNFLEYCFSWSHRGGR